MRFGIFYEHQLPRPWADGDEEKLLSNALDQVELADQIGIQHVWEVEHHFLEEYSHSSAPEVFLAAASQRTSRIRLGHGIVALPLAYNHPARVAERIATLDLISGGRVEFGTGETSSQTELGGFGVPRDDKREQWEEALDAVTRMFVEQPFAGADGKWLTMPPRAVVPKPKQKPHPPLWVACSRRESILMAARKGMGALSFSFVEPEDAKKWVDDYYSIIESDDCVPAGFAVNPNVAVVVPLMLHEDEQTAIDRGIDGGHFFGYSLAHYYVFGDHRPGRTDIWSEFQERRAARGFAREIVNADKAPLGVKLLQRGLGSLRGAIGTPEQVHDLLARYQAAGVDQVIFAAQVGRNRHEHVLESLELFGKTVLPHFASDLEEREEAKAERLAPALDAALARRSPPRQADPDYVISVLGEPAAAPTWRAGSAGQGPAAAAGRARAAGRAAVGRALAGANEATLNRTVGSRAGLTLLFAAMARGFSPTAAAGFTGDIQYELTAGDRVSVHHLHVEDGRARARKGAAARPAVTLRTSVTTFVRLGTGQVSAPAAVLDGLMQVEGDLAVASRLGEIFGGRSAF
jgi:alkanesulfonate monooxygenase SsuD/methylene tetrahydromethanopterin reductase-like flavin-dependent oxidoreductase (luciferase family)/putative sterol carrier protein